MPNTSRTERVFAVALFAIGAVVRWLFVDGDYGGGDEAWYLYLAKDFGREPGVAHEQPWFHIANRPLFYALYHPSTYLGLYGFRSMGCIMGASCPVLAFFAARRLGATFLSSALAASFLALQAQQLKYSASVFPDMLAAAFALAGVCAVAASAHRAMFVFSLCTVASKESFVLVPVLLVLLDLQVRQSLRLNRWHWLAVGVPVTYVVLITAIGLATPSLRLQGWSSTPFTVAYARNMWVGLEAWPLLAWIVWRRQVRILILWLGLPLFYLAWTLVLGRGLAPWYVVGPAALSSVAAALAFDFVVAPVRRRWLRLAVLGLCLCCFARLPLYGLTRVRAQLAKLDGRAPRPDPASRVQAVIAERAPTKLVLVNCFWAYRYTHLRGAEPAHGVWWGHPGDTEHILAEALAVPLVVVCKSPGREAIEARLRREPFRVQYEDGGYFVVAR